MKTWMSATALLAITATPGLAAVTLADLDITGDNYATFEEVRNVIPQMDRTDFNAIDTNGDRRLSANEIRASKAQNAFSLHSMRGPKERPLTLLDQDGDGFMSYDDMKGVYPSLTAVNFDSIDTNGDNRISYVEYYTIEAQTVLAQCSSSTYLDLASMDTNNDNFLSMEELKGGYPKVTNANFDTIDLNKDNRISSVELLAPTAECLVGKN